MKFHPYSEIFPLIEGADFDALVTDIKAHGLREPIFTFDGKVLDGRNRFLACQKAKVKHQFRQFKGTDVDARALVISANVHRRHLTESQRAIAAAKMATLEHGGDRRSDQDANLHLDRAAAAEALKVSKRSVASASKVINEGSKPLLRAVESGEVSVSRAASVVDLPKSEQLAAAKAKPEKKAEPDIERWEPEGDEEAQLEHAEREYTASIDRVMAADDKLAAAHAEIKRQAAEIASLKLSRNGFQNKCEELIRRIKGLQRQNEKLKPNGQHGARTN